MKEIKVKARQNNGRAGGVVRQGKRRIGKARLVEGEEKKGRQDVGREA